MIILIHLVLFQPQEDNAKVIIAFDGNFQLRRLKSAGNDIGHRLIEDNYIKTFDDYQNWLAKYYNSINVQTFNKDKVINILIYFFKYIY